MPSRSDQQAVAPDDSHETIARLEVALDSATAELDALRRSRTFRYTARLRAGYARARGLVRQTDGAAAKTGDVAAPSGVGLPERRQALARRFLRGEGIEIGPLHQPLRLDPGLRVRYVDRMTVDALRSHYAELADFDLVEPDIVCDGETLPLIPDASVDFVIANHFYEHCQDPLTTLRNHLRVLRDGGVLYLALPDRRHTFDRDREVTPLAHVVRDFSDGPDWSRRLHFEDWARNVHHMPEEAVGNEVERLLGLDYSIHFHVWEANDFLALVLYCRAELAFPLEVEAFEQDEAEFRLIIRKVAAH